MASKTLRKLPFIRTKAAANYKLNPRVGLMPHGENTTVIRWKAKRNEAMRPGAEMLTLFLAHDAKGIAVLVGSGLS